MFFPSPVPPRSSHLSAHAPTLSFLSLSLFRKQTKNRHKQEAHKQRNSSKDPKTKFKINKQKTDKTKNMSKQGKIKPKVYKNTIESVLGWPASPSNEACPPVWLIYPGMSSRQSLEETEFSFASGYQWLIGYSKISLEGALKFIKQTNKQTILPPF